MCYESKRAAVLVSPTHLVEVDLLRQGEPLTTLGHSVESDYRILISRGQTRPKADLYAFNLPDVIPTVPIPLVKEDAEPLLNLQQLIDEIYERGGYGLRVNYQEPPVPKLSEFNANWLETRLQQESYR
ncbi:MAG: DUF4058 family protein [Cyanobacteria bacterium J06636_28]